MDTLPSESRRPGITKLCERLARQNPSWSKQACILEAKNLYTSKQICHVDGSGRVQTIDNPDYMAARDR